MAIYAARYSGEADIIIYAHFMWIDHRGWVYVALKKLRGTYRHTAYSRVAQTTLGLYGFAVDLLDDCLYSKSVALPANLQHFATNGFVYNILT